MKKGSNKSYKKILWLLSLYQLMSQDPFLEIRPYTPPSFEQYPVSNSVDHHHPHTNLTDEMFLRFDGFEFTENLLYPNCIAGSSCYDGHAGIDYFMPLNTPILSPADAYVLWASFSPAADPCPGGISPNGDQGTIILAHGNGYFTVYLHLNEPLNVSVGENVVTGDTIGFNGNTGCAINAHLHFEVRKDNYFFDNTEPYVVDPFGWWHMDIDPIEEFRNNRSEWLWVSNDLIDDGDNGFQRFSGSNWNYFNSGYNNDCWTAPSVFEPTDSRHYAIWVPYLEQGGEYNIEVFIPIGFDASTEAIYQLNIKDSTGISSQVDIVVDQNVNPGFFHTIYNTELPPGSNCSVILRDLVSSGSSGSDVVFDAIRFSQTSTSTYSSNYKPHLAHDEITFHAIFPNPFNSVFSAQYNIKNKGGVSISITDLYGRTLYNSFQDDQPSGIHTFNWCIENQAKALNSSGIYFLSISSNGKTATKKMVHLK